MDYALEMRNITKEFPGVRALSDVSIRVRRGEVHALMGENGAGKSTLMKILDGVYPVGDYVGQVVVNGQEVGFPVAARCAAQGDRLRPAGDQRL